MAISCNEKSNIAIQYCCPLLHKYVIGPETVDWAWGDWDEWSECTVSCGIGGIQTRTRFCIPPKNGGHPCPSLTDQDTQPCNIDRCPGRLPICTEYDFIFSFLNSFQKPSIIDKCVHFRH